MKTSKVLLVISSFLVIGLALSACSGITQIGEPKGPGMGMDHGGMDRGGMQHEMPITDRTTFALAMIPHHQQALIMSGYAKSNTTNKEIFAIASQIISEQAPEIEKMTPWLNGQSVNNNMVMQGMLDQAQLQELSVAKGAMFDQLYITYMVMHHEGAIAMATKAASLGDQELATFSLAIIKAQSEEIATLHSIANQ